MGCLLKKCQKMLKTYSAFRITFYGRNPNLLMFNINRGYVSRSTQCRKNSDKCKIPIEKHQSTVSNGTTAFQQRLEYNILTLLGEAKSGKVTVYILEGLVDIFERTNYQLYHNLSVLLLKCCGSALPDVSPTERQSIADRIWKILQQRKIQLTEEHYNTLLTILKENSQVLDPKSFLESMTVEPTKETYYHLLNLVAAAGNYRAVTDVLSMMRRKGFPLDQEQYNALVYVNAMNGNMTNAEEVIQNMRSANIMPTSETYLRLALGYVKCSDISNVLKILKNEECTIPSIMELVRNLILVGQQVHIPDVLGYIKQPLSGSASVIVNTIIQCMCERRIEEAYMIIENVPATAEELKKFVDLFLMEMTKFDFPVETVSKYIETITAAKHISNVLLKTVEYSLRAGNETLTLKLFELMKLKNIQIRTHYYWPLLVNARKSCGMSAVYTIMKHMVDMNVKVDIETLYEYVFPYVSTINPITALNKVRQIGIRTSDAVTALLMALLDNNNLSAAMKLHSHIRSNIQHEHILKKLVQAYYTTREIDVCISILLNNSKSGQKYAVKFLIILLHNGYIEDKDVKAVMKFFAAMKARKVEVPKADIILIEKTVGDTMLNEDKKNIILQSLKEITIEERSEDSPATASNHPRYMNITRLYGHITELKAKKMNIRGALRKLFVLACKENNLQQVEEIIHEYNLNHFKWTPGMKTFLFQFYIKMNMKDEAKKVLSEINRNYSTMKIDSFKIVDYATMLVRHGEIDEAFSIVQKNVSVDTNINSTVNCWHLLTSIVHSNDFHRIHEMIHILVKNEYCKVDNKLLAPIVRIPLERNDINTAIKVFEKCVMDYQKTPLQQEVMTRIVKEADTSDILHDSNVTKMLSLLKRVHNNRSAITTLIVALCECNKPDILQNVLLKNVDIHTDLLVQHFKSLPVSKRLSPTLVLLEACQNVQKESLEGLYELILFIYSELGDCLGATTLWMGMSARNVQPTRKFQKHFVQLLTSHKFPLPPNVAINS